RLRAGFDLLPVPPTALGRNLGLLVLAGFFVLIIILVAVGFVAVLHLLVRWLFALAFIVLVLVFLFRHLGRSPPSSESLGRGRGREDNPWQIAQRYATSLNSF